MTTNIQFVEPTPEEIDAERAILRGSADLMREVIAYAKEEMRNRGIEAALEALRSVPTYTLFHGDHVVDRDVASATIRKLKRDPRIHLGNWTQPTREANWG